LKTSFRHICIAWIASTAILTLVPSLAHAHLVQTGFGTFYDGITHLFITPSDILVAVGLGLLAGLCGLSQSRAVIIILPAAWLIGGLLGSIFPAAGTLPWLTTLTFGSVGFLIATAFKIPRLFIAILCAGAGIVHGLVSGATMAAGGSDLLSLIGASLAVFFVVTLVSALAASLKTPWTRIAVRVVGSWIGAIGLLMLGWLVRKGG
jgi:urease accessory protein